MAEQTKRHPGKNRKIYQKFKHDYKGRCEYRAYGGGLYQRAIMRSYL